MSWFAAGAAAVSVGTSVGGGIMGKGAAKKAKKQNTIASLGAAIHQQNALKKAIPIWEQGLEDAVATQAPYAALGEAAWTKLAHGLGFDVSDVVDTSSWGEQGGLMKSLSPEDYKETPSYNFVKDEAGRGINRSAAAKGLALSGQNIREQTRMSADLASKEWQGAWDRDMTNRKFNVDSLTGAGGVGFEAATQIGNWKLGMANKLGGEQIKMGDAWANAILSIGGGQQVATRNSNDAFQGSLAGAGNAISGFVGGGGGKSLLSFFNS